MKIQNENNSQMLQLIRLENFLMLDKGNSTAFHLWSNRYIVIFQDKESKRRKNPIDATASSKNVYLQSQDTVASHIK